jgi:hypothetical protein
MRAKKPADLVSELKNDGYLPEVDVLEPPRSDADKMVDEAMSIRLLAGFDVDSSKNVKSPGHFGVEERELRAALARTIRDQMKGFSAELLALAIDPFTASAWPGMRPTRKIRFMGQGQQSTLMIEKQIIDFIRKLRFNSTQEQDQKFYIMSAVAEFKKRGIDIEKSRIHAIWSAYEEMLKAASIK